jgi:FkbM family methyltransferase
MRSPNNYKAQVVAMRKNLIYDVGLHKGEDTDFYLRKGFSVVGIEANPILVANAKIRFKDEIESGRLKIIEGAVAPASVGKNVVFYGNTALTVWGTIDAKWASRNEAFGGSNERMEVNRIEMTEVYRSLGIPFYLKVDVEGVDRFVVEELKSFDERPQYLSLESEKRDFNLLKAEMDLLRSLGYKKFKIAQQQTIPGTKIKTRTCIGAVRRRRS